MAGRLLLGVRVCADMGRWCKLGARLQCEAARAAASPSLPAALRACSSSLPSFPPFLSPPLHPGTLPGSGSQAAEGRRVCSGESAAACQHQHWLCGVGCGIQGGARRPVFGAAWGMAACAVLSARRCLPLMLLVLPAGTAVRSAPQAATLLAPHPPTCCTPCHPATAPSTIHDHPPYPPSPPTPPPSLSAPPPPHTHTTTITTTHTSIPPCRCAASHASWSGDPTPRLLWTRWWMPAGCSSTCAQR